MSHSRKSTLRLPAPSVDNKHLKSTMIARLSSLQQLLQINFNKILVRPRASVLSNFRERCPACWTEQPPPSLHHFTGYFP